jgi:hypothetical protein
MEIQFLSNYIEVFRSGLIVGMVLAVSAGFGGMIIYYVSRIFKLVGG